jgi:hypothetical protein
MPTRDYARLDREELRLRVCLDIRAHMEVHGRKNWNLVRERPEYAHIIGKSAGASGKRQFYRWVDDVSKLPPLDKTRPRAAREIVQDAMYKASKRSRILANTQIPWPISPAYILRAGQDVEKNLDLLDAVQEVLADAELMREYALNKDGKIQNPAIFDRSISRRLRALVLLSRVVRDFSDYELLSEFYLELTSMLFELIERCEDDLRDEFADRVEALNERMGATPYSGWR